MSAYESSDAGATTKFSGEKNVPTRSSQSATTSKHIIDDVASVSSSIHSSKDSDSTKHVQLLHMPQVTGVAPSPHPVVTEQRQNASSAKRVIRKVMVIDPKKLQQAGLDRKLAEAIGRQKLKELAQEKKKGIQNTKSIKLLTNKPPEDSKASLVPPLPTAAVKTTFSKATTSIQLTTPASYTIPTETAPLPTIKKFESVGNDSIKLPAIELTPVISNTATNASQDQGVIKTPAAEKKVFITPKITITRPGEEISPLRIVPEHRLENVKYILQCRILKKQQLAAQAAQALQQTIVTPTSTACLSSNQLPLLEPKVEMDEIPSTSSAVQIKKPSPAKTPQDIARVLDFSSEATTVSSGTVKSIAPTVNKVQKTDPINQFNINNYGGYVPKLSPIKTESEGRHGVDIASLTARVGTVTMRKDLKQSGHKAAELVDIPKANIRCKNLVIEPKNTQETMPKLSTEPNSISKIETPKKLVKLVYQSPWKQQTNNANVDPNAQQLTTFVPLKNFPGFAQLKQPFAQDLSLPPNTKIKLIYKTPLKRPVADNVTKSFPAKPKESYKTSQVDTNPQTNNDPSQLKDFPAYSPLKTPFPVVTHSQDLPLPTISTFRTPFPTTLIKVGQMEQFQNGNMMALTAQDVPTPAETDSQPSQSPSSLIVLENKVLSPDEKIDLTALGLETPKIEPTSTLLVPETREKLATSRVVQENVGISQPPVASASVASMKNLLPKGAKLNNRTILSMDKLQLSAEKIAELVKIINAKNLNSKRILLFRKPENKPETGKKSEGLNVNKSQTNSVAETLTKPLTTTANEAIRLPYSLSAIESQSVRAAPVANSSIQPLPTEILEASTSQTQIENNLIKKISTANSRLTLSKAEPLTDSESQSDPETQFKNPLPLVSQESSATSQFRRVKSSDSVIDSGEESDASISAVDFIASLAAEHPITEETQLELSPEELNLNASFAMNFSPLRIPNRDRTVSIKSEINGQDDYEFNETNAEVPAEIFEPETMSEDVQIGKIITISEENILKAVAASQVGGDGTSTEAQEIFKLTKSTECVDAGKEEVHAVENVNNLHAVNSDNLAESKLGSILVENIEIGVINKIEKPQSNPLIVENIKNDRPTRFGQLSTSEEIAVKSPSLEAINSLPAVSEASAQNSIIPKESNASNPNKIVVAIQRTQNPLSPSGVQPAENSGFKVVTTNANLQSIEKHNCTEMPQKDKQSMQTISIDNVAPKIYQAHNFKPSVPLNVAENIDFSEKTLETSSAAPKRLPRFKKGRINLIQRKKTSAGLQEIKIASEKTCNVDAESVEEVEVKHNQVGQVTVLKEEIETVTKDNSVATEDKFKVNDVKEKPFSKSSSSKIEEDSTAFIEPMPLIEGNDHNSSDYANVQGTCDAPVQNECVAPIPNLSEQLLKSSGLERKAAEISEPLNPPKMPKRRPDADNKSESSSVVLTQSSTNNLLLTAVTATTENKELTPVKNPFKKTKVAMNISEKPIKGLQNLMTKFGKDKHVIDQPEDKEQFISKSVSNIKEENISVKTTDAVESPKKELDVESAAKNQLKSTSKNKEEIKHNKKPDSGQELIKTIAQNQTEESAKKKTEGVGSSMGKGKQLDSAANSNSKCGITNLDVLLDIEKSETAKVSIASNECDNINVIASEHSEVKVSDDNGDRAEQRKSDFLGFDHSSPSTLNIESNLQHILTITNSAEKIKTRDENFSTAERESPHAIQSLKRSWSTTGKVTPVKTKAKQTRKSTNRRSVPLKKRWGVIRESEDDIEITDDTSPAEDEEDTDEATSASFRSQINSKGLKIENRVESGTEESGVYEPTFLKPRGKQVLTNEIKGENDGGKTAKFAKSNNISEQTVSLNANRRRARVVTFSESTSSSDLETPSKKTRVNAEPNTFITTKAAESEKKGNKYSTPTKDVNLQPNENIPEKSDVDAEPTMTSFEFESNSRSRRPCSRISLELEVPGSKNYKLDSRASAEVEENTKESTQKPKSKRGRKPKVTIEFNNSAEIQLVAPDTNVDQNENEGGNMSALNETENDSNQKVSMKKIDNENSRPRKRRTKNFEAEETKIEAEQLKAVKSWGKKPKVVNIDDPGSGTTGTSKEVKADEIKNYPGRHSKESKISTSTVGVTVKEEFVVADTELVVPSLNEMEAFQEVLEKSDFSTPSKSAPELATSTPSAVVYSESDKPKKTRKKRKSLGEMVVSLAINQVENESLKKDEITSTAPKKRGRKPKSLNATLPSSTESAACNSITELKNASGLNDTQPESSINSTAVIDSSVNLSLSAADFETPIKIPKKRGRKPKALTATAETLNGEESAKPVARKARVVDLETRGTFNERLLLITKRAQLDTDEVLTAEPVASTSKTKGIACGLCLQQMVRGAWVDHLATHYGVGWIMGETTPTNVTIRNEVLKAMTAFLKTTGGQYLLTCRMCQRTFRSALGALLHIELCGATDSRVPCEYCKREYSKLSVDVHMRECRVRFMNSKKEEAQGGADASEIKEPVFNNFGRMKRASVQKAEKILKAIGCDARSAGIITAKDAKNYIELVPARPEQIEGKWSSDLEATGKAYCPTPDCSFEAHELARLQAHYECCELKEVSNPKGFYICQLCANSTKTYNSAKHAIKHVLQEHRNVENAPDFEADVSDCGIKTDDESSGDDDISSGVDSNEESASGVSESSFSEDQQAQKNARRRKSRKKKLGSTTNTADRQFTPRDLDYSRTAVKLWMGFATEQYSTQPLFKDFKVNYHICARADYEQQLPRTECSMKFNLNSKLDLNKINVDMQFGKAENLKWSQLQRFEMSSTKNEHFIFLGEAIKIVCWVPLPADIHEQYLLITTRREYTRYKNPKVGNTLLWLYKITPAKDLKPLRMQLHYAINIPDGPVHCMAFLPSGGYDSSANRLGLVAIGTAASSTIKVYALPLDVNEEKSAETDATLHLLSDLKTVQLEPVFLLTLEVSKEPEISAHTFVDTQCTTLCWSEFSGHQHIFAGYANGCVGYWDISTEDNLNILVIDGLPHYLPMNFFYARAKNVRAMAIHYDTSGVRLLALTVGRRILSIYDLQNFTRPKLMKEEVARNEVMDLEWSPLWQSLAVGVSDSLGIIGQCTYAVSPTNINFKSETIDKTCGSVTQIHYNPWQHIFANATDNGDLVLLNIREMHFKDILRDSMRNTRAVAIMDMKCLNGEDIPKFDPKSLQADWKFFEEECEEKYGLVFGPMTRIDRKHRSHYMNQNRRPPVNLIRCTRINSMRCNLNVHGKKLIALGYENGLLRILKIDRKSVFD